MTRQSSHPFFIYSFALTTSITLFALVACLLLYPPLAGALTYNFLIPLLFLAIRLLYARALPLMHPQSTPEQRASAIRQLEIILAWCILASAVANTSIQLAIAGSIHQIDQPAPTFFPTPTP